MLERDAIDFLVPEPVGSSFLSIVKGATNRAKPFDGSVNTGVFGILAGVFDAVVGDSVVVPWQEVVIGVGAGMAGIEPCKLLIVHLVAEDICLATPTADGNFVYRNIVFFVVRLSDGLLCDEPLLE